MLSISLHFTWLLVFYASPCFYQSEIMVQSSVKNLSLFSGSFFSLFKALLPRYYLLLIRSIKARWSFASHLSPNRLNSVALPWCAVHIWQRKTKRKIIIRLFRITRLDICPNSRRGRNTCERKVSKHMCVCWVNRWENGVHLRDSVHYHAWVDVFNGLLTYRSSMYTRGCDRCCSINVRVISSSRFSPHRF